MQNKVNNPAPAPAVEQKKIIRVTLHAKTLVTPELVKELDKLLFYTDGGNKLWDAHYALLYEFLNSGKKPKFLNEEINEDSYFLGLFLSFIKHKC
jgi:hypothetical protein